MGKAKDSVDIPFGKHAQASKRPHSCLVVHSRCVEWRVAKRTKYHVSAVPPGATSGTGGTGFVAIQLAKALGISRVVTSTNGAADIALAKQLGADVVIDYEKVYDSSISND